jgi:hypothetical protein
MKRRNTQLVVENSILRWKNAACSGKKQLATCSEKLCLMHAVERRDTQLVVEKFDFAVEKQCV